MTVGEILEALKNCDPDMVVLADHKGILAVDEVVIKSLSYENDGKHKYINLFQ